MFENAMTRHAYRGNYTYCYCLQASRLRFVLDEVLKNNTQLEISSTGDAMIVKELYRTGRIDKDTYIICNGHKQLQYTQQICELIEEGFNVIPVIDSLREIGAYEQIHARSINVGIRIASDETQSAPFRTSRLGVRYSEVCNLYRTCIQHHSKLRLRMLHFHVDSGIRDTASYWSELACFLHKYCKLRKVCPSLDSINIGGGLPIAHSPDFSYDYAGVIDQIVETISKICTRSNITVPHLFTEFGRYTVGESGATIYQVIEQKQQNATEVWYMINGSFINHALDVRGKKETPICLPINNWSHPQRKVLLGGSTCNAQDYYTGSQDTPYVEMPRFDEFMEDQYVGLLHTGAHQEETRASHFLVPVPKHVIMDRDEDGKLHSWLFTPKHASEQVMRQLGYGPDMAHSSDGSNLSHRGSIIG